MLLTILVVLYMFNECEGRRRRRFRRVIRRIRLPKYLTINTERKREALNDDNQGMNISIQYYVCQYIKRSN